MICVSKFLQKRAVRFNFPNYHIYPLVQLYTLPLYVLRHIMILASSCLYVLRFIIIYILAIYISYAVLCTPQLILILGDSRCFVNILPSRHLTLYNGDKSKLEAKRSLFRQTWTCLPHGPQNRVI